MRHVGPSQVAGVKQRGDGVTPLIYIHDNFDICDFCVFSEYCSKVVIVWATLLAMIIVKRKISKAVEEMCLNL